MKKELIEMIDKMEDMKVLKLIYTYAKHLVNIRNAVKRG